LITKPLLDSTSIDGVTTYSRDGSAPANNPDTSQLETVADAHLRAVVDAWPKLPEAIRSGIVAMVAAAKSSGE
jgi:hypothetical protein